MKTTIPDKYRAMQKVIDCIDGCITIQHICATDRLICNFHEMYKDYEATLFLEEKSFVKMLEIGEET